MSQNIKFDTAMGDLFNQWMKSISSMWESFSKKSDSSGAEESKDQQKPHFQKFQKSVEFSNKLLQSLFTIMSEPENLNAFIKGSDTIPEFVMTIFQQLWDGYFELNKQWLEHTARIGQHTKAYNFEGIDQTVFQKIREVYEKEFQKYFNVPQIGLTRYYQERINKLIDKFNIYQTAVSELIYLFYVPIEKSLAVMQEKIDQMVEKGELHDNFKEYYSMWIKILEGHYMKLLQSPEYTQVMDNTIAAVVNYKKIREEVWYDILQQIPVPTFRDMDELYKEFYLLKKKVKDLTKQVEEMSKNNKN